MLSGEHLITLIQRYSIHDGPGIRTVVFLKGCPLNCLWCCNPECQSSAIELLVYPSHCNACNRCSNACDKGAILFNNGSIASIDRDKCDSCLKCVNVCSTKAIQKSGDHIDTSQILDEVLKDKVFYRNSGGGVTISGGEPLFHWQFTLSLLQAFKKEILNTALETCGYASWQTMSKVTKYVDLVLFDIKHMDPVKHRDYTGKDNALILENAHKLGESGKTIWLRLPLIPGYNDSPENLSKTAILAKDIKAEKISILPYHEFGESKYKALNRQYPMRNIGIKDDNYVQRAQEVLRSSGVKVTIGF